MGDKAKAVKAKLTVRLFAGTTLVAESADEKLWHAVLGMIQEGGGVALSTGPAADSRQTQDDKSQDSAGPVADMAKAIGVSVDVLEGACGPRIEEPYLHLDSHAWEAFTKNTPNRGPGAVASGAAAGTLLALWCKYAKLPKPSTTAVAQVLAEINVEEKNMPRSLRNCPWLQLRDKAVQLHPAEISRARKFAKAFCEKEKLGD